MRKPPTATIPDVAYRQDVGLIIMTRRYELLTPLFGGGVAPGVVDGETPIHGTGIRGQLRFWWRATRAGRFNGDAVAMRSEEDRLWGSTKTRSLVSIAVVRTTPGLEVTLGKNKKGETIYVGDPESPYGYVAFPLRETQGKVYKDITFDLRVSLPNANSDDMEEVRAAFWAWDTFGGVGARTRRGFGALRCIDVTQYEGSVKFDRTTWQWEYPCATASQRLLADVRHFVLEGKSPPDVPHLSRLPGHYLLTNDHASALRVWKHLIDQLRAYRQNRPEYPYGRNNWPEPDAIRALTGQALTDPDHTEPVHDPPINKFPRAAFGLPIIFGFHPRHRPPDDNPTDPYSDPRTTTLQGASYDRLASPLILRPLPCAGGRAVGLAAILNSPRVPPGGLVLIDGDKLSRKVRSLLEKEEALQIAGIFVSPWNGRITVDVLQSFLNGLKKEIE